MKIITALILSCALTAGVATTAIADTSMSSGAMMSPSMASAPAKNTVSFSFVLQADQGQITKGDNGQYNLTLTGSAAPNIIMFSDRPKRIVKSVTLDQLKNYWQNGTHSFKNVHPNAVLSANGLKPQVVVLDNLIVTTGKLTFAISPIADGVQFPATLMNPVIVIDQCVIEIGLDGIPQEVCYY